MDDLNQQINQILSDPNSMQQIQGIMSALGMGGGNQNNTPNAGQAPQPAPPQQSQPAPTPAPANPPAPSGGGFDPSALAGMLNGLGLGGNQSSAPAAPAQNPLGALSALGGLGGLGGGGSPLGGVTPEMLNMVTKLGPLLSRVNQEDDSTRLLNALRPLLSGERQKKVDEAMKILQMMRLLPLLKESGVFSGLLSSLL